MRDSLFETIQGAYLATEERQVAIEGAYIREWFLHDHNPEKGQTAKSEMNRWLEMLKQQKSIIGGYSFSEDKYYFIKRT